MKKLEISQMENLQGGWKCTESQYLYIQGLGLSLTLITGGTGAWIWAGASAACYATTIN